MISDTTVQLVSEVVNQERPIHQRELDVSVRQFTFKMSNQGILDSGAAAQGLTTIFCETFDRFAAQLWNAARRVLQELNFRPYDDAELHIMNLVLEPLSSTYFNDSKALLALLGNGSQLHLNAQFADRYERARNKVVTEIKLLCASLRTVKNTGDNQMSRIPANVNVIGANARVNINSTDNSTNIVNEAAIFAQLRAAIESHVSDFQRKNELLKLVSEGESAPKRTPIYDAWFCKFIGLCADVLGVVQPFVPALMQMLANATT